MSSEKRGELSQLIGETIISYRLENEQLLRIACDSGRVFHVALSDDGGGTGNDSHAYFENVLLHKDRKITLVREEERNNEGARFAIECSYRSGVIEIIHDSNGWYGWDMDVTEVMSPAAQTP